MVLCLGLVCGCPDLLAATIYYVDKDAVGTPTGESWSNAFPSVVVGLAAAGAGDEIWVAEGVYTPGIGVNDWFQLAEGESVYGGFSGTETNRNQRDGTAHPTVLSGDLGGGTNARHVVFGCGTLDSLIISGGRATSVNDSGGGWLVTTQPGEAVARNCIFTNNVAVYRGGALAVKDANASVTIESCTFVDNVCTGSMARGGAAYIDHVTNAVVTISNCLFRANVADMGAGLYFERQQESLLIVDCTFVTNTTTLTVGTDGGALSLNTAGSNTVVSGCVFSNNVAWAGAGAMLYNTKVPDPLFTNCTFVGNTAQLGAGISSTGGDTFRIHKCVFTANTATTSDGGAVRPFSRSVDIRDTVFDGNQGQTYGGAVSIYGDAAKTNTVAGCTFAGNSVVAGSGGGVYFDLGGLAVSNCTFTENSASQWGGAVCGPGASTWVQLSYSQLLTNQAANSGGAVYIGGEVHVDHCVFARNRKNGASNGGGALATASGATAAMLSSTFVSNSAAARGGAIFLSSSTGSATNCIFSGNTTDGGVNGPEVYVVGTFAAAYCNIDTSKVTNVSGLGAGIINVDPQFADPANDDYHLKSEGGRWTGSNWVADATSSLCINAGDPATAIGDEPAPNGGIVNLGRYGGTAEASKSDPDADNDGMLDDWEMTHFTDTDHTGAEDTDSDGLTDYQEFVYPSNPTNAASPATDTHYVADENPNAAPPYTNWYTAAATIQDAVDWTTDGDTVLVSNGVYDTGATVTPGYACSNRVVIANDITVSSVNGPGATFIKGAAATGGGNGSDAVRGVYMSAGVLSGFTVTNGHTMTSGNLQYDQYGGGVNMYGGSGVVSNSILVSNSAGQYGGGSCYGTLYNCLLMGNSAGNDGGGSAYGTLHNCTVTGNSAASEGGGGYEGTLDSCIIYFNTAVSQGDNWHGSSPDFSYCCITPDPGGTGNITNNPQFMDAGSGYGTNHVAGDYRLSVASTCFDAGSTQAWMSASTDLAGNARVMGSSIDMGAYEGRGPTLFVDAAGAGGDGASWAGAFTDLADALAVAIPSNEVWIARGTYSSANTYTVDVAGVSIYGGFTNGMDFADRDAETYPVTLSGQNSRRAVYVSAADVTIDGITITAGLDMTTQGGGGLRVENSTGTEVLNCRFVSNRGRKGCGAAFTSSSVSMSNCVFASNIPTSGGAQGLGLLLQGGQMDMVDCAFSNHQYSATSQLQGGAVFSTGCVLSMRGCGFRGNRIRGGSAGRGGGAVYLATSGSATMVNCEFVGNSCDPGYPANGGAVYASTAGQVTISNCTFSGNYTYGAGGAIFADRGNLDIGNCILWTNAAVSGLEIALTNSLTMNVAYTDITGTGMPYVETAPTATLNINSGVRSEDPMYAGDGDVHLMSEGGRWVPGSSSWTTDLVTSACIDTGDPGSDYSREPEPNGGAINLGAYGNTEEASKTLAPPPADGDGDGMDDDWETTHFANTDRDGTGDYDGDGLRDYYEFLHGTIPTNAANPAVDTHYVVDENPNAAVPYTNWYMAAATIQDAVNLASHGDSVIVSNGVYDAGGRPEVSTLITNRVCLDKQVTLSSVNGPGSTFIVGSGPQGSNAVRCVYVMSNAWVSGFTLTNGHTFADSFFTLDKVGGGARCDGNGSVSNCVIIGNEAGWGGGVCSGMVYNCTLSANTANYQGGGIWYAVNVSDCLIEENSAGTSGGGVWDSPVQRSVIKGNTAVDHGGGTGWSMLRNCLVVSNSCGGTGGGGYGPWIESCTIADNASGGAGGGMFAGRATNSIVYFNTSVTASNDISGTICEYTCTPAITAGTGNISDDPLFVDRWSGDYRLAAASPSINTGLDEPWMAGATDLAGTNRILHGAVDMGCYEIGIALSDRYTKLLLHCNGTDGSTNFTDSSVSGHSVTANGDAQVSEGGKFAEAALFDGTGDYLSIPDSDDFDLSTNDFTFDCWFRLDIAGHGDYQSIANHRIDVDNFTTYVEITPTDGIRFAIIKSGTIQFSLSYTNAVATNRWYHVAVVREGNTFTLYVDGVAHASDIYTGETIAGGAKTLYVGSERSDMEFLNGAVDEVRISAGIARWTSDFTPPDLPDGILDADDDGMDDDWEIAQFGDTSRDGAGDYDGDGVSDVQEYREGTDPTVHLLSSGLIAHFPFDGTPDDVSADALVVSSTNAVLAVDRHVQSDRCYWFDGSGDFIQTDGSSKLQISNALSIALWVNPTRILGDVLCQGTALDTSGNFQLQILGNGKIMLYKNNSGQEVHSEGSLSLGEWQHLAVTFSDGDAAFYINGTVDSTGTAAFASFNTTMDGLTIGEQENHDATSDFLGRIDDIRVYNRALSSGNVAAIYALEAPVDRAVVTNVAPMANALGVATSVTAEAWFNKRLEPGTVASNSVIVHAGYHGMLTNTWVTYLSNGVVTAEASDLLPGEVVTVTATDALKGTNALSILPYTWQFIAEAQGSGGVFASNGPQRWAGHAREAALGDLNGDGKIDAVVARRNNEPNHVLIGNGSGSLMDLGGRFGGDTTWGIAIGDIDNDGDLDAVAANYGDSQAFRNDGLAHFSSIEPRMAASRSTAVALGDIDGDGDLDAVFACEFDPNRVFLNDGTGLFTNSGQLLGSSRTWDVALGDVNGDGMLDAVFANIGADRVYLNQGNGEFVDSGQSLGNGDSRALSLVDLNGDGHLDLWVASASPNVVYTNNGSGTFVSTGQSLGNATSYGVTAGDFDGDNDIDVYVANYNGMDVAYRNNGDAWFTAIPNALGTYPAWSCAHADMNSDGLLDVVVVRENLPIITRLNQAPPSAPTLRSPININATEFTARWNFVGGGVTGYALDVASTSNFVAGTYLAGYSNLVLGAVNERVVLGTVASTTYYYRVRAIGAGGPSANSPTQMVVTPTYAQISLSTPNLAFSAARDTDPAFQTFVVTNTGASSMTYTNVVVIPGSNMAWAAISPTGATLGIGGTQVHTVQVWVASMGLPVGDYAATNYVTSAEAANSPFILPITLTVTTPMRDVTVASDHGTGVPAVGVHSVREGTNLTLKVLGSPVDGGVGTQYVCTGWVASEDIPPSGSTTSVTATINNDSAITWQWQTNYALAIAATNGWVNRANGFYPAGAELSLVANWAPGYHFTGWTGDVVSGSRFANLLMDGPKTVTANFEPNLYTINASAGENGSITPSGAIQLGYGDSTNFTITASNNYRIVDVVIDGQSIGPTTQYTFTNVTQSHSIQASFVVDTYFDLTVYSDRGTPFPSGNTAYPFDTNISCSVSGSYDIVGGTTQYVCTGWTGTGSVPETGLTTNVSFTITNASSLTWEWETNYYLSFASDGEGHVDTTNGWRDSGTPLVATAVPSNHYHFTGWTGTVVTTDNPITVSVDRAHALTAGFAIDTFTLDVSGGANGTVSPTGMLEVAWNTTTNIAITPNAHYHIDQLLLDSAPITPTNLYTFANVATDHVLNATFAIDEFNLTVASAQGAPKPSVGVETYPYNASVACSVASPLTVASTQYVCLGWTGTGSVPLTGATTNVSVTVTNISGITWRWQTNYWLSATSLGNGTVTSAQGWLVAGSMHEVRAIPKEGYRFNAWHGDVTPEQQTNSVLSLLSDRGRSIQAEFVAVAPVVYVDHAAVGDDDGRSWANAFTNLQDALGIAVVSQSIWVAEGTYLPGNSRSNTFMLPYRVPVYGGFANGALSLAEQDPTAHRTILSGDIGVEGDPSDNCYHIAMASGVVSVCGVTLADGVADGAEDDANGAAIYVTAPAGGSVWGSTGCLSLVDCVISNNAAVSGAAVYVDMPIMGRQEILLTNCLVVGNVAVNSGGGIGVSGYRAARLAISLVDSAFVSNRSGAGAAMNVNAMYANAWLTATGSRFVDNAATNGQGGAIWWDTRPAYTIGGDVSNCVFVGNQASTYGGAMFARRLRRPIVDCDFAGNQAQYGGALYLEEHGTAEIAYSRFGGNSATSYGGGVYSCDDSPVFHHCEFSGNKAYAAGRAGAAYFRKVRPRVSVPQFVNCTLINNAETVGNSIYVYTQGGLEFQPSCVNTIIWDDDPAITDVIDTWGGASITGAYSCVKGDLVGPGMTNAAPGFSNAATSTWTAAASYESARGVTRLETTTTNFAPAALVGSFLRPDVSAPNRYPVVSNDVNRIWILGDASAVTAGTEFSVRNYQLTATNSPCIDSGVYVGYPYTGSAPDMGARERGSRLRVRVILAGAYTGEGEMSTRLRGDDCLPTRSPYTADPREAAQLPTNAVDWVLLELRHSPSGKVEVAQSAFLGADGYLVSDNGDADVGIEAAVGSYYVAVKHRNHVTVLSSSAVSFGASTPEYDFTTGADQYYGGSSNALALSDGRWGMFAGDADGDGAVRGVDMAISATQNGRLGYQRGDVNLDGVVDLSDVAGPLPEPVVPGVRTTVPRAGVPLTPELPMATASVTLLAEHGTVLRSDGGTSNVWWGMVQNQSGSTSVIGVVTGEAIEYWTGSTSGVDVVEAWDGSNRLGRISVNIITEQEVAAAGRAVIIAGRQSKNDILWPTTDYLAGMAYDTLLYRGFSADTVQYLSPAGPGDGVDGFSSHTNVAAAFTNFANAQGNLFVYLVDHGGNNNQGGYLKINKDEELLATELDAWLDAIQGKYTNDVIVVVDCCQSGSFLDALTYDGPAKRIVITACGSSEPTYFIAGGLVSFSEALYSGVLIGSDLGESFTYAQQAMSQYQTSLISSLSDASGVRVGASYIAARDVPQIGRVVGQQSLMGNTEATLWADDIVSVRQIASVWCSVVPVDHQPSNPSDPVTDLVDVTLTRNPTSGRYEVTYQGFAKPGAYTVFFYAKDTAGAVSPPRQTTVVQTRFDERIILVVGGVTTDAKWETANKIGNRAYHTFRSRLFDNDHIQYLNDYMTQDLDDDSGYDVDDIPTITNLAYAVTNWADVNESDELTLYLVGYGPTNAFYLNREETLEPEALAEWLNSYQEGNDRLVNVFMDFNGAGAFIPVLQSNTTAAVAGQRICVASTRADRPAVFANEGSVSFSQYLLSGMFRGRSVGDAVTRARKTIRRASGQARQVAEIDDSGNGRPNEKNVDGVIATERFIGSAFVVGSDTPTIGTAIPNLVISNQTSLTIWAGDVTDADGIGEVWCVLTPPEYKGHGDLPRVELAWQEALKRYEYVYTNFVASGQYALTFYASDVFGEVSPPVQRRVTKAKAPAADNGLDAYENDSSRRHATHVVPGVEQIHGFHSQADEDWVWFIASSNLAYDIETVHIASNGVDTVLDLYFENSAGDLELVDHVDLFGFDEGELMGLDFPPSGIYFLRVGHDTSQGWAQGGYSLLIDVPVGLSAGSGILYVQIVDRLAQTKPPPGAQVTIDGETFSPGTDGVLIKNVEDATYTVGVTNHAAHYMSPDTNTWPMTKQVVVPKDGRGYAYFLLLPYTRLTGTVLDSYTGAPVSNAVIRCATGDKRLGQGETLVFESYPDIDSVANWQTDAVGSMPENVFVPRVDVDVVVSAPDYETNSVPSLITSATIDSESTRDFWLHPVDTNENGFADSWEETLPGGEVDENADSDGDGSPDVDEYLAGSDPLDPNSVLAMQEMVPASGGSITLKWPVVAGRTYRIMEIDDLVSGEWTQVGTVFKAETGQSTLSCTVTCAASCRYYRIELVTSNLPGE